MQRAISEYRNQLYEEIIKRKKALRKQQRDAAGMAPAAHSLQAALSDPQPPAHRSGTQPSAAHHHRPSTRDSQAYAQYNEHQYASAQAQQQAAAAAAAAAQQHQQQQAAALAAQQKQQQQAQARQAQMLQQQQQQQLAAQQQAAQQAAQQHQQQARAHASRHSRGAVGASASGSGSYSRYSSSREQAARAAAHGERAAARSPYPGQVRNWVASCFQTDAT